MSHGAALPTGLSEGLRGARHVCVLTGAGISAESGVPTFREARQGLWERFDPLQLATPDAFLDDPALVWRWYRWRRELVARAKPNAGHRALAELAAAVPRLTLVTQNVDGLHQRAGSTDVIEFHGNLFDDRCFVENVPVEADATVDVPTCPACNGLVRPGVVWFGEAIPQDALERSFAAAADCDVFLLIGTSALVFPAAGLADVAIESGAMTVEINPRPTEYAGRFTFAIAAAAGVVLPELIDSLADQDNREPERTWPKQPLQKS